MKRKESTLLFLLIMVLLSGCSDSTPTQKAIIGKYRLIKVRENGTMLTIGHQARIELSETMYISELDINQNGKMEKEETAVSTYRYYQNEEKRAFLEISSSDIPVELLKSSEYDLLLRRIDSLGNETIMYLEK